ncbi:hypothetical protein V6N12_044617 [Hibiscus sabdariffa]|uniref:RNase H type-1 domain-containing protein n=1 Tax=Hibiscus sabdariffa TaxID=183260 RepID=A0ABR2AXB9_9ROSI
MKPMKAPAAESPANWKRHRVTHLANLLDAHGNWDTHKLSALFDIAVIPHVLSIRCPDPLDVPDMPTWRLNVSQTFDIKSAYTSLMGNLWDTEKSDLEDDLVSASAATTAYLSVAHSQSHALEVWNRLIPPGGNASFYSGGIIDWLHSNVTRNELHLICGLPWQVLFVSIIWQLWKARNDLVFNGTPPDAGNILQHNREAIKRLNASTASSDPCSLVRSIAALRSRGWATETQWIPREGNKPADMLAKLDNLPCFTVTVFSQPPEHLLSLLDFDQLTSL